MLVNPCAHKCIQTCPIDVPILYSWTSLVCKDANMNLLHLKE